MMQLCAFHSLDLGRTVYINPQLVAACFSAKDEEEIATMIYVNGCPEPFRVRESLIKVTERLIRRSSSVTGAA